MAGVCKKSLTRNSLAVQLLHMDGKGGNMSLSVRVRWEFFFFLGNKGNIYICIAVFSIKSEMKM